MDANGLYVLRLTVEAYYSNWIGPLTLENHQFVRSLFVFRSPYNTLTQVTNIRRVDELSPLRRLAPEELDPPAAEEEVNEEE